MARHTQTAPASGGVAAAAPTRERIRAVAENLYVLRGHDGFSFADIAEAIGTTRANIHHHFGNKRKLMAELIDGFVADAQKRIEQNWTSGDSTFFERLAAQLDDLRRFYSRFNKTSGDRNVWSPLSRLRLDLPVLGEIASRALERVNHVYDAALTRAVTDAIKSGELSEDTPVEDVARLLRVTFLSSAPMTQDTGSIAELERLFGAIARTIEAAWGQSGTDRQRRRGPALRP
jgi:AcrR family transcriptional regulator